MSKANALGVFSAKNRALSKAVRTAARNQGMIDRAFGSKSVLDSPKYRAAFDRFHRESPFDRLSKSALDWLGLKPPMGARRSTSLLGALGYRDPLPLDPSRYRRSPLDSPRYLSPNLLQTTQAASDALRTIEVAQLRLAALLERWQQEPPSREEAVQTLQAEATPLAAVLKRYTPKDAAALAAWIAVFLMLVQIVMGCQQQAPRVIVKDIDRMTVGAPHQHRDTAGKPPPPGRD
ncbi:MAG: hypothetical protein AABM66_07190 [Actinomycetota bacterium]